MLRAPVVLLACLPAISPLAAQRAAAAGTNLGAEVRAALDRARGVLLDKLPRAHGGQLALLFLAAAEDGVPSTETVMRKAAARLLKARFTSTYELSVRLLALVAAPDFPRRAQTARQDCARLLECEFRRGGFGYHPADRRWDLSNTQYAVLGLRAAVSLGAKIPNEVWERTARATAAAQQEDGGFAYTTHQKRATMSMTAAGIAVMSICAPHLEAAQRVELDLSDRLRRAWAYVAANKGEIGDRNTRSCLYFHYGLERACILGDVEAIDSKDWYRSGAEMLLGMQLRGGGWHSERDMLQGGKDDDGSDAVSTSFAVLFLRRGFQKHLSPIVPMTAGHRIRIDTLGEYSSERQCSSAIDAAVQLGTPALPEILCAMRSAQPNCRAAAAKALFRITGEDFGYNPHLPPERSGAAIKAAEKWWFDTRRPETAASQGR